MILALYRKYKGCVGGIRSIYCLKDRPYFASVGLDRFLRIRIDKRTKKIMTEKKVIGNEGMLNPICLQNNDLILFLG